MVSSWGRMPLAANNKKFSTWLIHKNISWFTGLQVLKKGGSQEVQPENLLASTFLWAASFSDRKQDGGTLVLISVHPSVPREEKGQLPEGLEKAESFFLRNTQHVPLPCLH